MTDPRIEEMTADQPADPRPAIHDDAAEFDAQVRVHYDRYEAQLAAIRQLAEAAALAIGRVEALCDNLGADFDRRDIRRAIGHEKPWLAVLDGVPGTTQQRTEKEEK